MSVNNAVDDDSYLFAGQEDSDEIEEITSTSGVWRILIVDDEPEIHKVSELALSNLVVLDRRLEFLHAYTGKEAIEIMAEEKDIAVVLLDVVMESDDAGLKVVQDIREQLKLHDTRIILRTGQPGYAPEEKVVIEYDINDYKTKTELTRNKLLTSVFSAIRSYSQIIKVRESRDFLDELNNLNSCLISQTTLPRVLTCLLEQTAQLLKIANNGCLVLNQPLEQQLAPVNGYWVVEGSGEFSHFRGQKFESALPDRAVHLITKAVEGKTNLIEPDALVLFISGQSANGVLYFNTETQLTTPYELIQTFVSNVASDLDNTLLLKQVSDVAYLDRLTNLPNRARFIDMLGDMVAGRKQQDTVVLVDIDHFSDINDGLGYEVGNQLLLSVSQRLQQLGRDVVVSRTVSDVFGLIGDQQHLTADKVLALFEQPFKFGEHVVPVNATIGVCHKLPSDKLGVNLLKHANIALNRAKNDIRSRVCHYLPEMEDETSWRLGMIRRLTSDFQNNKLQVWYQPQINCKTGKFIGMEALLRWPDGSGGYISPMTFIPLAEYSGLIVDIGAWVLEQSCKQMQQLQAVGINDLRIAVNVSMPQFRNSNFVQTVIDTVTNHNIAPDQVELEITESVVMDDPQIVVTALQQLKEQKFTIAIDDFGTGFSSLSYLHQLPLDRLKVDRAFIKDIGEGGDGILAETIINLGQKLGLETIAEGIENELQLNYVRDLGCDEAQGFYHAKPMPGDELITFLQGNS